MVEKNNERPLMVLYDVADTKKRNAVHQACLDYGLKPVQYSVFFGWLDAARMEMLTRRLSGYITHNDGNIMLVPLEPRQLKCIKQAGEPLG